MKINKMEQFSIKNEFEMKLEEEILSLEKDFGGFTEEEIEVWLLRDYRFHQISPEEKFFDFTKYIRNLMAKALRKRLITREEVHFLKEQLKISGGRDNFRTVALLNLLFEILGEARINEKREN